MASFISLKYGEYKSFETSLNFVLGIVVVFIYCVYFIFVANLTLNRYKEFKTVRMPKKENNHKKIFQKSGMMQNPEKARSWNCQTKI